MRNLMTLILILGFSLAVQSAELPEEFIGTEGFNETYALYAENIENLSFRDFYTMTRNGNFTAKKVSDLLTSCNDAHTKKIELEGLDLSEYDLFERKEIKLRKEKMENYINFCNGLNKPLSKEN